jgi:hypothetical protein
MDGQTRSWRGLTAWQVVFQSTVIHEDWDATTHAHYLVGEEGFDAGYVEVLPIEAWLNDPTHAGYLREKAARARESVIL